MQRHMFINTTNAAVTVYGTANETLQVYKLASDGTSDPKIFDITDREWSLEVPAGWIYGFCANGSISVTSLPSGTVANAGVDKNPWPPPPPPPPRYIALTSTDYTTRYNNFLVAISGSREAAE